MELVDMLGLEPSALQRVGSSPTLGIHYTIRGSSVGRASDC